MVIRGAGKQAEAGQIVQELEENGRYGSEHGTLDCEDLCDLNEKVWHFNGWNVAGDGSNGAFYKDEPVWDSIRDDPRFAALIGKMVVPETAPKPWSRTTSLPS